MLASTAREDNEVEKTAAQKVLRAVTETDSGVRVREMGDADLERILELRSIVRWSADPRAFDLLRGVRDARWAVAEAPDGDLAGMVGAVPLGDIGVLCHLAVHDGYRGLGLGVLLSSWAVAYLRSRGAKTLRLYSTRLAEGLYRSLGFEEVTPRTVYRLEEGPRRLRVPDQVDGHRVETLTFGDLPELYGVDLWSYGADRSALLFATLRLHPGRGLVVRDSTGWIKGYLIRSARGRATRIGPFLASTPDVASLLLARALSATGGTPVQVTVPGPARCHSHALLQEFGFEGTEDRMRMELGEKKANPTGLVHYGTTPYLAT
ncbi:MAG: GCN5-related N-acetyltransferase [Rubrobacteraceae bacterium]|nr:GCN5-related N-acetyltransferase [Rubrobacteraceae bacterium]